MGLVIYCIIGSIFGLIRWLYTYQLNEKWNNLNENINWFWFNLLYIDVLDFENIIDILLFISFNIVLYPLIIILNTIQYFNKHQK